MGRLGGLRGRALFFRDFLGGRWSIRALFYWCGTGIICRFCRLRTFFRQWALTYAFAARFELVITGFDRIITVAAGAGDIVICLFNNAPTDDGKNRDDEPG